MLKFEHVKLHNLDVYFLKMESQRQLVSRLFALPS